MKNNNAIKAKLSTLLESRTRCFGFNDDGEPCKNKDLTISHMLKDNTARTIQRASGKIFDYSDYQNTIPLCRICHAKYEKLPANRQEFILSKQVYMTRLEYLGKAREIHEDWNTGIDRILNNHINRMGWFLGLTDKESLTYD